MLMLLLALLAEWVTEQGTSTCANELYKEYDTAVIFTVCHMR